MQAAEAAQQARRSAQVLAVSSDSGPHSEVFPGFRQPALNFPLNDVVADPAVGNRAAVIENVPAAPSGADAVSTTCPLRPGSRTLPPSGCTLGSHAAPNEASGGGALPPPTGTTG